MTDTSWEDLSWEDEIVIESSILRINDTLTIKVIEDLDNWHLRIIDKTDQFTNDRPPLRKRLPTLKDAKRYAVEWAKEHDHIPKEADILLE